MKANNMWEWKRVNGDRGVCLRSRLGWNGWNSCFQHPCPGPGSWIAQIFLLWPLMVSLLCTCVDPSSIPLGISLPFGDLCHHTWAVRGTAPVTQLHCATPRAYCKEFLESSAVGGYGRNLQKEVMEWVTPGKLSFELLSIKDDSWPWELHFFYIFYLN